MNFFEYLHQKLTGLLKKIGIIKEKAKTSFIGNDLQISEDKPLLSSNQIYRRQLFVGAAIAFIMIIASVIFLNVPTKITKKAAALNKKVKESKKINVEVASSALEPQRMWFSHYDDRLEETQLSTNAKLDKMSNFMEQVKSEIQKQTQDQIQELKKQLLHANQELQDATNEIREMNFNLKEVDKSLQAQAEANLESLYIDDDTSIGMPKDSKIYIPETARVEGILIGGISVSTAIGSEEAPIPVQIRLTGRGTLPKNFAVDLRTCKIQGSTYGNISNERATIRLEVMVCTNDKTDEVLTTKIAGTIFGDDGMNGIRGKIIDMSTKHIQNAALGGILSGLANTMKPENQFTLSSLGAVNTSQKDFSARAKDNALTGLGSTTNNVADYFIKRAEIMSPVLEIYPGRRIDVSFTKGVYLGSTGVVKAIEKERNNLVDEIR